MWGCVCKILFKQTNKQTKLVQGILLWPHLGISFWSPNIIALAWDAGQTNEGAFL